MEAATALAADDPIMVAWNEYAATDDYKNSFKWAEHEQYRAGSMWAAFLAGWQASHPASAPAPAAPRVGGDVLRRALNVVDLFAEWERRQGTLAMITPPERAVICEMISHAVVGGMNFRQLQMDLETALSAPPAASADEREELGAILEPLSWRPGKYFGSHLNKWKREKSLSLASAILDAGYRKLAPAQSVGQSAAQGVGEVRAQTIEEIAQWFLSEVRYWGNVKEQDWSQHVVSHLRRLSALPKGQEHE